MSRNVGIGEVYTTKIQKPHFSGLGVYDPNKVFYKEDENGKVKIDGKLSTIVTNAEEATPITYITLGGKKYDFIEWNGLLVITEDLKWDVGTWYTNPNAPEPIGYYYDTQVTNVSTIHLALRAAGYGDWRIPKPSDWTKLINEPTITLPCSETWEREHGIAKLLSDDSKFRSVFPYNNYLNESGIGLNPCRIATSTASQFDRANYMMDMDNQHNVILRYNGGYTVVTANYGNTAGACIRLVKDAT